MNRKKWIWCLPLMTAAIGMMPSSAMAAPVADEWVYEDLEQLAGAGYLELPQEDLHQLSRKDLASLVGKALDRMESYEGTSLADEYGRVTKLLVEDKVQLGLAKEQLEAAGKIFRQREREARRDTDALARQSLRGNNRLEVMEPLQKRAQESQMRLQGAARDFAIARQRALRRQRMADELEQRQNDIMAAMTGASSGTGPLPQSSLSTNKAGMTGTSGINGSAASLHGAGLLRDSSAQDADAMARLSALRTEFVSELDEAGSLDKQNAHLADDLPVKDVQRPRLHIDGEVRLSDGKSTGDRDEYRYHNSELRLRVYPDYNIDGNWHAIGMVEGKKEFGNRKDKDDEKLRLDRYYLEGNVGLAKVDAGAFGSLMAEGNIYDSKFRGIRIEAGVPVKYAFEYGKANDTDKAWDATADYVQPTYSIGAGVYRFEGGYDEDNVSRDGKQSIAMANVHKLVGRIDLGAMVLYGKDRGHDGTGYVISAANGQEQSWKPRSRSWWLKYYYQPYETYYSHTMNGTADLMRRYGGFKGWGAGYSYTLSKDWLFNIEYYHLWDLDGHKASNTIWGSLTTYFKNYED